MIRLRHDPEHLQRPRLERFLGKLGITDIEVGHLSLPLSELSLDGLEAVAAEEIACFRSRRWCRTQNRALQIRRAA